MFDDEFFSQSQVISNRANHTKIKFDDVMEGNNIRQVHEIFDKTGLELNPDQREHLQTACRLVIRKHAKTDPDQSRCSSLISLFNHHKKGKKTFKNILTYEKSFFIPHNIKKFSKNIDCTINLSNSKTMCSLWKNSFMDNEILL